MSRPLPTDAELAAVLRTEVPGARAAWLFGSGAKGRLRADSDIDLAVVRREPLRGLERYDIAARLALRFGRDVDLLDFERLSPVMKVQVIAGGRILFDDQPVTTALATASALRDWQDAQPWRRLQRQALIQRLQAMGAATR